MRHPGEVTVVIFGSWSCSVNKTPSEMLPFTSNGVSVECTHTHVSVCVSLLLDYSMRIDPSRETSMSLSLWGEWAQPLQLHVALSNCLTAFFFFPPTIHRPLDKRIKGLGHKKRLILHYLWDSGVKVGVARENKSHHKRLRYGET